MCKYYLIVLFIFISSILSAQPPVYPGQWQSDEQTGFVLNPYTSENNKPQFHSFSNSLGTHVIVRNLDGSTVENKYRLIGNNGQTHAISSLAFKKGFITIEVGRRGYQSILRIVRISGSDKSLTGLSV